MTADLYDQQVLIEEESRGLTIKRYHDKIKNAQDIQDTDLGSYLLKNLIVPFSSGIKQFIEQDKQDVASMKAKKHKIAAKLLADVDPDIAAFLFLKTYLGGKFLSQKEPVTLLKVAYSGASTVQRELAMQRFAEQNKAWADVVVRDMDRRDLSPSERERTIDMMIKEHDLDFNIWTRQEGLHVGYALVDILITSTGAVEVISKPIGKHTNKCVAPTEWLLNAMAAREEFAAPLMSLYPPMVYKPRDWTVDTLEWGAYLTDSVQPYQLVKRTRRSYRNQLKELAKDGDIEIVLESINALQNTEWQVNKRVLDVLEWAFDNNVEIKKLPRSEKLIPDPPSPDIEDLPRDDPRQVEYRGYCFRIHEFNRNIVGARSMAIRTIQMARKYSQYEKLYFPHDLDSRGRAYPKPVGLNPQGTDYVKGLLRFSEGKPIGRSGRYWLGVHGANSFGMDKLPIGQRYQWAVDNSAIIKDIAERPKSVLDWIKADNPFQFLAFCFEWAEAHELDNPEEYISHLHVDLDATCSGLQHFSAMLRDSVGGSYVNMVPSKVREDVYQAVADLVTEQVKKDEGIIPDLLLELGVDRSVTKRSVMVQPYAGTRSSCYEYVSSELKEKLGGRELDKETWKELRSYATDVVWKKIPEVVIAADEAMRWLKKVTFLVGKSQGDQGCIKWTTPLGLPVEQRKNKVKSERLKTFFQGSVQWPRIYNDLPTMDPRKMSSSVPPSLVHSLDAAHMMYTVYMAKQTGINSFAAVHDSFGTHAADVDLFSQVIRHAFVDMYEKYDPLKEFLETNIHFINEELRADIPPMPAKGKLDLSGVLENEFFFS